MKESNLVQNKSLLNRLPKTWLIKDFKDVVIDNSGGNRKLANADFLEKGEIAVVDQGKLLIAGYHNNLDFAVKTRPPYIIFGDHTRIFKFIDFPFIMGADGTKVLQPINENCDTKYLYYFFLSINVPETGYNRHFKYLKELKIPLPPLEQQKKIASILDAADAYRQKTKALIAKYDELTQSLFMDMFGDPVKNEKGWEKEMLKSICNKITDGTHDTPKRLTQGIKFITGKHIKPYYIDFENSDYVTEEVHTEIYKRCNPEFGDILYTNIGVNYATAALNSVHYEFSMKNVALLKYKREILNGRYLECILNNINFKDRLKNNFGIGGAQQFLSLANIKSIEVLLPPIKLQNRFAELVQVIEEQKAQAQANLDKAEELFNSLLQRAFKGELV